MAFFRVKLRAQYVAAGYCTCEFKSVICGRQNISAIITANMVRVDEIKTLFLFRIRKKGGFFGGTHSIPSHVRNFKFLIRIRKTKTDCFRINPPESRLKSLLTASGKQLHAEAYSQNRRALLYHFVVENVQVAHLPKVAHAGIESTDAGQYQAISREQVVRPAGEHDFGAKFPEHVYNRAQIAHAVIYYNYHAKSLPARCLNENPCL